MKKTMCVLIALALLLSALPKQVYADVISESSGDDIYRNSDTAAEILMVSLQGEVPTYTGQPQEPVPTVTYLNNRLVEGRDYTVSYENNVNAGEAYVVVTGCGDYEGLEVQHPFTISRSDEWVLAGKLDEFPSGVVDGYGNTLVEGKDYFFLYSPQTSTLHNSDGSIEILHNAVFYGIGNYIGTKNAWFLPVDNTPDEGIPEGTSYDVFLKNNVQDVKYLNTGDSIRGLVQPIVSDYFIPIFSLYKYIGENIETDNNVSMDELRKISEKTYYGSDLNMVNCFEYQFRDPGVYLLVTAWREYTQSSYVENGQVIYTEEPTDVYGSHSLILEVTGESIGGGGGSSADEYEAMIESVEPTVVYSTPHHILVAGKTTPKLPIAPINWVVESGTAYVEDESDGFITLMSAGTLNIVARFGENHYVRLELVIDPLDISHGARIEMYDHQNQSAQVTFDNELMIPDQDYTLSVTPINSGELVKVTITGKNLFTGRYSALYYADTGYPYYCDHNYTSVVTEPTCTEGGYTTYTCSLCENCYIDDETAANGHTEVVDEGYPATCTDAGLTGGSYCAVCKTTLVAQESIEKTGHDYKSTVTDPTCTEGGFTKHTCHCGDSYVSDYRDALDHSWGRWQIIREATSDADGEQMRQCSLCKEEERKSIPATGTKPEGMANPFVDVAEDAYYYAPVLWAVNEGITNGMDATHFAPDGTCTRAQIVTFLWRACGSPAPAAQTNPFADVPAGQWYTDAVLWAVEKGITTGTSATTFSPDAGCTRGQVATFLWRSHGQPTSGGDNIFADVASGAYYYNAVLWAVESGITNGMGDGTFAPDATCTRGQIVTFLYRAMA